MAVTTGYNIPRLDFMSAVKTPKPEHARAIAARRTYLGKSAMAVENQTGGVINQKMMYRIEAGKPHPLDLDVKKFAALLDVLEWSVGEFNDATGLSMPSPAVIDASRLPFSGQQIQSNGPHARLMRLRQSHDLTSEQLAEKTGLGARRIRNLEENPELWPKITRNELVALAQAYSLPVNELLAEVNMTPYPAKPNIFTDTATYDRDLAIGSKLIPEYDMAKAGPGGRGGDVIGFVDFPEGTPGEQIAYRVSGDSMSPEINDNDTVVIRVQNYSSPKNTIVCWTPDDGTMVKHLKEIKDDGTHVLSSHNTDYPPIWAKEIHIFGVVVQIRKNITIINGNH